MKIRLRNTGSQTKNQCSVEFNLPAPSSGKTIKVLSVTCPDMPLIPAIEGAFVVVSTTLGITETVDIPVLGSMDSFVDFLNTYAVNGNHPFDAFWRWGEFYIELLSPFSSVTFNSTFQTMFVTPSQLATGAYHSKSILTDRFDPSVESEVIIQGLYVDGISSGTEYTDRLAIFGRDKVLSGEKIRINSSDQAVKISIQYISTALQTRYFTVEDAEVWAITLEIE